jgi:hypothetical protein
MSNWLSEGGPKGVRTLIGVSLVKLGTAGVTIFPNVGIYYFSYYKQTEPDLTYDKMMLMYSLVALLIAIFSLFSVWVANRVGYALIVRILCFLYPIALYRASYC